MKKSRQSKGARVHLSTDKPQPTYQRSNSKQRKKTKNLYTLNKESQYQDSQSYPRDSQNDSSRNYAKSHEAQYNEEYEETSSDQQSHQSKKQNFKKKFSQKIQPDQGSRLQQTQSSEQSLQSSEQDYHLQAELDTPSLNNNHQNRIKKYTPEIQEEQSLKLHLKIKHLQQQNQLLSHSLTTHENRQKEMVSKFAKLEAQNKRLQFEITRINKSEKEKKNQSRHLKAIKEQIQLEKHENIQVLASLQKQNLRIMSYLKGLISKLVSQNTEQPEVLKKQSQSILQYLERCLLSSKQSKKSSQKPLLKVSNETKQNISQNNLPQLLSANLPTIFSYQTERISHLSLQNQRLTNQISKLKQKFSLLSQGYKKSNLQKQSLFKQQKKQLCQKYNDILEEIKGKSKGLQGKISEQEEIFCLKITELEKTLGQKEKIIKKLKEQLKQMNVKLDQFEDERFEMMRSSMSRKDSRPNYSKKKFIDGDYVNESENSFSNKDLSHEQSFYQYQPQKRKKKTQDILNDTMMRKSHKSKHKPTDIEFQREQKDLKKINKQIEQLERQILMQFQDQM